MSGDPEFGERLAEKTDRELFDILAHEADYMPGVVERVRREIAERNLSDAASHQFRAEAEESAGEREARAEMPLQWPMRILMFVFSFGLWQLIAGEYYRNRGYARRCRECWIWMGYGLIFWFFMFILGLSCAA